MNPQAPVSSAPVDQPPELAAPPSTDENLKQQIVSTITSSKNVLVTVGTNPTVDELASALGLTLLLSKLDKHATAVFSGKVPPAMEFLDPSKTFEDSVDSLRDFIIALDKEKADKLRYKLEEDVVKIFITPYKTVITPKDLQFSQGDFNVDVVIALGVQKREELDKAIIAHGRILHDATVLAINAGALKSNIGSVDWNDTEASSVAEMLVNLSAGLGADLLDAQISTAFLTGIVAETNRFSNEKTTPKVMTMSAQLMAAGANQQLIATNLRQEGMLSESLRAKKTTASSEDNGEMVLEHKTPDAKTTKATTEDSKITTKSSSTKKPKASKKASTEPATEAAPVDNPEGVVGVEESSQAPEVPPALPEVQTEDGPQPVAEEPKSTVDSVSIESASAPEVPQVNEPATLPPLPELETQAEPLEQPLPSLTSDTPVESAIEPPLPVLPEFEAAASASSVDEPASIVSPPSRDAMSRPQFGGTLNATEQAGIEDAQTESVSQLPTLEHQDTEMSAGLTPEAIEEARKAVADAAIDPPHKRLESIGSQALPELEESVEQSPEPSVEAAPVAEDTPSLPPLPVEEPTADKLDDPDPMQAFMQPTPIAPSPSDGFAPPPFTPPAPSQPSLPPDQNADLPPLPPLPQQATDGSLPPLPSFPAQTTDPTAAFQPQTAPEFMQTIPQTQNSWTQAGQDIAAQQADKETIRQNKIDEMTEQYNAAVQRNDELQGRSDPLDQRYGSNSPNFKDPHHLNQ